MPRKNRSKIKLATASKKVKGWCKLLPKGQYAKEIHFNKILIRNNEYTMLIKKEQNIWAHTHAYSVRCLVLYAKKVNSSETSTSKPNKPVKSVCFTSKEKQNSSEISVCSRTPFSFNDDRPWFPFSLFFSLYPWLPNLPWILSWKNWHY